MDLYKIYNLPALHPELKVEFSYELEGEYLAITKNKLYAALPTACLLYTSPSPRDATLSRMPSSA